MNNLNGIQTISLIGIGFGLFCQLALMLIGKTVTDMWALYPTWGAIFIFGTVLKYFVKEEEHHHHH